jgi:hypothetical protein
LNVRPNGAASTGVLNKCAVTLHSRALPAGNFDPISRLVQRGDSFYGTTDGGLQFDSTLNNNPGTIFKLTDEGKLSTVRSFPKLASVPPGWDFGVVFEAYPNTGLVKADDGNLYGSLWYNVIAAGPPPLGGFGEGGHGSVVRITPDGDVKTIHSFTNDTPTAELIQGPGGALYGGTQHTVFKVTTKGKLTTLHTLGSTEG